jgi:hypothetical protein
MKHDTHDVRPGIGARRTLPKLIASRGEGCSKIATLVTHAREGSRRHPRRRCLRLNRGRGGLAFFGRVKVCVRGMTNGGAMRGALVPLPDMANACNTAISRRMLRAAVSHGYTSQIGRAAG